jgi:hypothetical protein
MDTANVLTLNTQVKAPHKSRKAKVQAQTEPRPSSTRRRLAAASATAIGLVAVGATALSLADLAESIQAVAHCAIWKAWAFGAALDCNFIATEAFSLFCSAAVARETHKATMATKITTLLLSAVANSWAMAHTADGWIMQAACVAAGCAGPGLIALATMTLGRAVRS